MNTSGRSLPSLPLHVLALAAASAVCPGLAVAQNALQAAIDAAPPYGVVEVTQDFALEPCDSIRIDKPLTLLGVGDTPTISIFGQWAWQSPCPRAAVQLDPGFLGIVRFVNLEIRGGGGDFDNQGQGLNWIASGVTSLNPSAGVFFEDCSVSGGSWTGWSDNGAQGGQAFDGSALTVVAVDSTFVAGDSPLGSYYILNNPWQGASAIDTSAPVVLVRSTLFGGDGAGTLPFNCDGTPFHPPANGGDAISSPTVYAWGSVGFGGAGGSQWECYTGGPILSQAPGGAGLEPNPPAKLAITQQATIGGTLWFDVDNPGAEPVLLALDIGGWPGPTEIPGFGPLFLDSFDVIVVEGASVGTVGLPVPNQPYLAGLQLAAQALIGLELSNPETVVLLP